MNDKQNPFQHRVFYIRISEQEQEQMMREIERMAAMLLEHMVAEELENAEINVFSEANAVLDQFRLTK